MILENALQSTATAHTAGATRQPRVFRWPVWFGLVTFSAIAILAAAYLILRQDGGNRSLTAAAIIIMVLASIAGAAGLAWRKASLLVDALVQEMELRILAEKETEEELHTLQIEYQDVFMRHPAPMWIFDVQTLRILAVNDAACSQYGYRREEFLRMTVTQLRPESDRGELVRYLSKPCNSLQRLGTWTHLRKDGSRLDVEIVAHELDWRGRRVRLVMASDVTERLAAEKSLRDLNAHLAAKVAERTQKVRRYAHRLRRRKRELEIANRDLEMFSYSAAHDLRTPLWVMSLFVDLLLQDAGERLPADVIDQLQKIQLTTKQMKDLVDDLSKLAKVSKHTVRRKMVDLGVIARMQIDMLRKRDPHRQVQVDIPPTLQANVDEGLLTLALENLIGNAWKYSAYVPEAQIRIGIERRDGEDVLSVQDNGAGFDMQDARDLFKPFHRMHSEEKFEGTGIGLAIVQRVAAMHGGRVWANAAPDRGATFYLSLGSESRRNQPAPAAVNGW